MREGFSETCCRFLAVQCRFAPPASQEPRLRPGRLKPGLARCRYFWLALGLKHGRMMFGRVWLQLRSGWEAD